MYICVARPSNALFGLTLSSSANSTNDFFLFTPGCLFPFSCTPCLDRCAFKIRPSASSSDPSDPSSLSDPSEVVFAFLVGGFCPSFVFRFPASFPEDDDDDDDDSDSDSSSSADSDPSPSGLFRFFFFFLLLFLSSLTCSEDDDDDDEDEDDSEKSSNKNF